jgi:hypothetical protein
MVKYKLKAKTYLCTNVNSIICKIWTVLIYRTVHILHITLLTFVSSYVLIFKVYFTIYQWCYTLNVCDLCVTCTPRRWPYVMAKTCSHYILTVTYVENEFICPVWMLWSVCQMQCEYSLLFFSSFITSVNLLFWFYIIHFPSNYMKVHQESRPTCCTVLLFISISISIMFRPDLLAICRESYAAMFKLRIISCA